MYVSKGMGTLCSIYYIPTMFYLLYIPYISYVPMVSATMPLGRIWQVWFVLTFKMQTVNALLQFNVYLDNWKRRINRLHKWFWWLPKQLQVEALKWRLLCKTFWLDFESRLHTVCVCAGPTCIRMLYRIMVLLQLIKVVCECGRTGGHVVNPLPTNDAYMRHELP